MNFVTKKVLLLPPVCVSPDEYLPCVTSMKLLGVTLSSDMRWQQHIENVVSRASKRFYILRFMRKSACPSHILLKAYNALVRPLSLYCYPVFCNMPLFLRNKLNRLEKRALRFIGDVPHTLHEAMAEKSWLTLFDQVEADSDHPLRECFLPRAPSRRNTHTLRPPTTRTKRFKDSFIRFCPWPCSFTYLTYFMVYLLDFNLLRVLCF